MERVDAALPAPVKAAAAAPRYKLRRPLKNDEATEHLSGEVRCVLCCIDLYGLGGRGGSSCRRLCGVVMAGL